MKKIINLYKEVSFPFLLVITVFSSLFFTKEITLFIIALLLNWLLLFKSRNSFFFNWKWIWPYLAYVFVICMAYFFALENKNSIKILERHIPFVIIPVIMFSKKWSKKECMFFSKTYVLSTLLLSIISLIKLGYFFSTHQDFVASMNKNYLQWKLPHLTGFHPTYFGFIIVIATIILLTSIKEHTKIIANSNVYMVVFLTLYLIYLSPRTAVLCQFIVLGWFIYSQLKNSINLTFIRKIILLIFFCSVIAVFAYSSNYLSDKILRALSDKRFLLWKPALITIKNNFFLFGEGLGNGDLVLKEYIIQNNLTQIKNSNPHNQFLKNYLDMGIFGLITLCLLLYRPLLLIKNKAFILFSITCSISFLTESILYVIKGIVIFTIMSCFFILKDNNDITKNKINTSS